MIDKPDSLYFRIKDNGAAVFRVDVENQHKRLDVSQIAVINITKGEFRGQGDEPPTPEEEERIKAWISARQTALAERQIDDINRSIDHLNLTTQWVQSKATDQEIDQFAERMLMAMHDLRSVLVRKITDRIKRKED